MLWKKFIPDTEDDNVIDQKKFVEDDTYVFKMCCGPRLKAVKEENSRDVILNERLNSEEYEKYDRPQPHAFQMQIQENPNEKKQEQCFLL
jgi:hypothetical protein